jgi:hypothetical protein
MRKFTVLSIPLTLIFLFLAPWVGAVEERNDPVDVNLIIDGSLQGTGAVAWICDYVVDGMLQEGDHLRIWIAGEKAQSLYGDVFKRENAEAVKALLRQPLSSSPTTDFGGALQAALRPSPSALMSYTLLVSTPRSLSPARLGAATSYLRYSRVMEFAGWRALIISADISSQVREAAGAFLSGR